MLARPITDPSTALAVWLGPWRRLVSDTAALWVGLLFVHLAALVMAGGVAIVQDRAALRIGAGETDEQEGHLRAAPAAHRLATRALAVALISGLALMFADVALYWSMPVFWIKMLLVSALLINGALLRRHEARSLAYGQPRPDAWPRIRMHATVSIALWLLTILAGTALTVG